MRLNYTPTNLFELLQEVSRTVLLEAEKKKIHFYLGGMQIPENMIIQCDSIRLKQVFLNLITNALKFTHSGEIVYGVHSLDSEITFFVRDTGIGIPDTIGNKIFDRFMKVENDNNMLYRGNGLGLTICKSLVTIWEGKIWYTSEINKGTTFFFTHPIQKKFSLYASHSDLELKMKNIPDLTGKTIAIAEDEEANFKVLSAYLKNTHVTIFWAQNGKELVDYMKENHADLILLDIKMPILDGMEAIRQIREFTSGIPIIAQTAFAFEYDRERILQASFDGILVKPIKLYDLITLIDKYLQPM